MGVLNKLVRHKPVELLQAEAGKRGDFRRVLGLWQLTAIGIGGIIGVGVFVLAGQQAAINAGPAVALSFLIAGIASAAAALCYAEFAGLIPVTGSAYTYGYAVLGELAAWLIGWDLLLEYALIVAVVAIGWSGYVQSALASLGVHLPVWARGAMNPDKPGQVFDVIAAGITVGVAALLTMRTEWGARLNTFIVTIKVLAVALVIGVGAFYVNPSNWVPFVPQRVIGADGVGHFGLQGVATAAAVVFFAVFGYDTLTTAAEESKNPQRDLPRAVLLSLGISMAMYLAVSLVLTGIAHYSTLKTDAPVADAFKALGLHWVALTVSVSAVFGLISVLFAFMLGAARIWFALARDGLLSGWFAKVHPRYGTPYRPTIALGVFTALVAGSTPIQKVAELVNIGVLSAFIVICSSVIILRRRKPDLPRSFRTPWVPLIPLIGIGFSIWLLSELPVKTWVVFLIWVSLGLVIYFSYGMRHSKLEKLPG
ncbi:amino acid permease [Dyella soli]|uniref:Amino acid permease n=1 Tax=Dyella soli TaxID=522319 RepID=A0A4R0YJS0_9GAMM|nr:amino acid permease [Dyella soli]TCI06439.1 amino acid permease [Dyella soli]